MAFRQNCLTMKKFLLIFRMFLLTVLMSAQEMPLYVAVGKDVNGVELGQKIGHTDFISKFGVPDNYRNYESEDGLSEDYLYGNNWFHCEADGHLTNYVLVDNRFPALTKEVTGGIRVGDELKKNDIYGKMVFARKNENGEDVYMLSDSDDPFILIVKDNIIVRIVCDYSV